MVSTKCGIPSTILYIQIPFVQNLKALFQEFMLALFQEFVLLQIIMNNLYDISDLV